MKRLFLRFPGGLSHALTLSYDDGVETDRRLIEIMRENGLKGTFNLDSGLYAPEGTVYPAGTIHRRMTRSACLDTYRDSGMEVALHGAHHPFLTQMPREAMLAEIASDRRTLENDFGTLVRGAAYPFGDYNDDVVEALRLSGVAYCRTTVSTEHFDIPTDWLRMPATCHHNNPRLTELSEEFLREEYWGRPRLFYLWGHSYEFDEKNNWEVIENFARRMGNRDDIWYATNIEVHDYVEAFRALRFSLDGDLVSNPTSLTIWFQHGGEILTLAPGETRRLDA
ncbi:MAG: polysaccharide deacetylase family protein [Eubacteriales bacterium]